MMHELFMSPFFGIGLSIAAFWVGTWIRKKTGLVLCNPLVLAIVIVSGVLLIFKIPYEEYKAEMAEVFFSHASGGKLAKKPGVEELLKYLKMRGFKIGLASSTREALVRSEISDGGLLGYFDQIIGGDMVERSKPEPDIFLEACRRLGTRPENCYVIEDSHNGIRAAYAAGMHPIMVPDLMEVTEEMKFLAEEILGSLCAVQEFLQGSGI